LHATKQTAADALNDEKIISQLRDTQMIKRPAFVPGVLFLMLVERPA
jgi:hypothetical protein